MDGVPSRATIWRILGREALITHSRKSGHAHR